jgi:hypothetical protein
MHSPKVALVISVCGMAVILLAFGTSCEKAAHDPAATFWTWFLRMEKELRDVPKALHDGLIDQAYEKVRNINEGLAIEIGGDAEHMPMELIISAEGKKELFPLVEKVIAQAPQVAGWKFIALKPAMGFDFDHETEGKHLDPRKLWFQARSPKAAPDMLGLIIFIPGYDEADKTTTVNSLFKILDTALGERLIGEMIYYIDVSRLPADPEKEGYIKLVESAQYIDAYKKKQR